MHKENGFDAREKYQFQTTVLHASGTGLHVSSVPACLECLH